MILLATKMISLVIKIITIVLCITTPLCQMIADQSDHYSNAPDDNSVVFEMPLGGAEWVCCAQI